MEPNTSSRKRVLIVGGGFAGLNAAKVFHDVDCAVTVIDRNNFHTFQPLLYQVAMGALSPGVFLSSEIGPGRMSSQEKVRA
jgi:NADH dehydrogenase